MGTININWDTYSFKGWISIGGDNINVWNNQIINLKDFKEREINIKIEGDVGNFQCDNCNKIEVSWNIAKDCVSKNWNIVVKGGIEGNVETKNWNVVVSGSIKGSVDTKNWNIIN